MNNINQLNTVMPFNNEASLNEELRIIFMEVISESLRVSQRTQLFNWLQGSFQYLLGHEVMIFGVKQSESDAFQYEYYTSSRYFGDEQFTTAISQQTGLICQAVKIWKESALPCFYTFQEQESICKNYSVYKLDETKLRDSELKHFAVHGFGDSNSKISSVVIFGRLREQPHANLAHVLELIMPHLHCALIKVSTSRASFIIKSDSSPHIVTKRESEILQWLYMGKTNWEISSILSISPLTVKNHVQNLLRKLDVQNRSQAVVKAAKFGLIKTLN
jgi:transcriptional regulator EpsA